jgi:hypothetical protein
MQMNIIYWRLTVLENSNPFFDLIGNIFIYVNQIHVKYCIRIWKTIKKNASKIKFEYLG